MGSSPSVEAAKALNDKADLRGKTALIFGGTAGIGAATARRLASRGAAVTIVGRNETEGASLVKEFEKLSSSTSSSQHEFVKADLTLMANTQRVCDDYMKKNSRLDTLVFSQGFFTLDGTRSPTAEDLDKKLALHFYSRAFATRCLLPLLKKTALADKKNDVRVLSVLSGGIHSAYAGYKDDTHLTKGNFGLKNAADLAGFYNDLMIDHFASESADAPISFLHQAPGFVQTSLFRDQNMFMKGTLLAMFSVSGKSASDCAEFVTNSLVDPKYKSQGGKSQMFILNQYAQPGVITQLHKDQGKAVVDFVMKGTFKLFDSIMEKSMKQQQDQQSADEKKENEAPAAPASVPAAAAASEEAVAGQEEASS